MQQSTKERKIRGKVTHSDNKDTMDASCHCLLSKQTCLRARTLAKYQTRRIRTQRETAEVCSGD